LINEGWSSGNLDNETILKKNQVNLNFVSESSVSFSEEDIGLLV